MNCLYTKLYSMFCRVVDKNGNARVEEDRNLKEEVVSSPYSLPQDHVPMQQRKKREHQEILVLQLQDRKVTRSSSEERPLEEGGSNNKDNIRRVSSHEDFSKTRESSNKVKEKKNKINGPHQDFLTKMKENMHHETLPLGEHNSSDAVQPHVINDFGPKFAPCVDHGKASVSPAEILEDTAHEKRRNKERFFHSSTARGRRNVIHHRKKIHKSSDVNASQDSDGGESMKENKIQYDSAPSSKHHGSCVISSYDDDSSQAASSCSSSSPSFLQICTEEKDTSPTPSCSSTTPPLDLSTLHQQVDSSEPQTSLGNWSFSHFSPEEETECSRVMLSPRSSMVLTQRMYLDPSVPPSPPQEHNIPGRGSTESKNSITESRIKQLTKEMNGLKKKLKRYEEEFEKQNGYRPSHADKLANKDIKKVCSEITIIRKDLKCLKENSEVSFLHSFEKSLYHTSGSISSKSKPRTMEETLRDVEKHLVEKRKIAGRPEDVDQLTREQVIEEKVSLQKALLYMENLYGRPVTKEDRDMVRPLYDRYRVLKRLMIRFGSSKLKDSMSELATILEHETMDFTNSPTGSLNVNNENDSVTIQPLDPVPSSDALWENLHSLPLSELLEQQRATKEEKKQLRRTLREFEEDFQRKTGKKLQKDDHTPIDNIYSSYKQAKAKLRLLEALVTKQT